METKLCRICGKLGQNYVNIFRSEGLRNRIETCLPIIISPHSLLPDTICGECSDNVDNFYSFIKNCLQNIIILEAQYDITDSCLKTKRKQDRGCMTESGQRQRRDQHVQTEDYLDVLLKENEHLLQLPPLNVRKLVDYDLESDSGSECVEDSSKPSLLETMISSRAGGFGKRYFDDAENYLISEIAQRKSLKRRNEEPVEGGGGRRKVSKMDTSSRRKSRQPKKLECVRLSALTTTVAEKQQQQQQQQQQKVEVVFEERLPQVCLLCEEQFIGPSMLAAHVFETHGIDMAHVVAVQQPEDGGGNGERRKRLPNLLKISDLRKGDGGEDTNHQPATGLVITDPPPLIAAPTTATIEEQPPTLLPSFVCPLCPAVFTARPDLFTHLRVKHADQASLLCGICLHQAATLPALQSHVAICCSHPHHHQTLNRYYCQICRYGDDSAKSLENHVLVHDFLLHECRKQARMFDPADYVETNECYESGGSSPQQQQSNNKTLSCVECGLDEFDSFKEFSAHRRSQHSIFHCDLCNKFYGRNSHLWKHVNRLHKGHPSITCQLCYKTSASKYHLAQHFNKIHSTKSCKQRSNEPSSLSLLVDATGTAEDFMQQKFQAFDFQSVKQSFMRQELLEKRMAETDDNCSMNHRSSDGEEGGRNLGNNSEEPVSAPKEIDSSSDLYTNIITNYTPPANEGEFKCPKCGKGFHKKTLLKKHKKNCRPRLQKDLLTRCKSCARIFKDRQSLAKHLVNYHSEYACEICGQKVQSKCEIVSHIRFSHPGCHLFCTVCGNILRSRNDLADHNRDHLNSYVCQFCADALPSKIKLKMHILSLHRKILSLSCGVCLKLFESQHVLRDHVRLVHREQLAPLTSCPVCGKNYGSKWKTYDHLNKSHGRIFKACKACLEVFDTESQLQAHYDTAHANSSGVRNNVQPPPPPPPANFDSESGGESMESDGDQDQKEEEEKDYVGFLDESKISLLEKRLLGKKITEEDKCPRVVPATKNNNSKKREDEVALITQVNSSPNPQQNSSKRTVYVNSNDPSFCEICLKTWPAKKHLWQHYIRCHKSVAATVCGICLKTNNSYASLQAHLRQTHPTLLHGQGFGSNFICRICGRYHNASSKLKLHMAIHENFDWSLLEQQPRKQEEKKEENGYEDNGNDEINYESLIEQVECSSGCDSETETVVETKEGKEVDSSSEEDEDEEDEESEESMTSENSLEAQMLNNMLREKQISENSTVKDYVSSVSEEDSSGTSFSVKSEASSDEEEEEEECSNSSNLVVEGSVFGCKREELDSAIQSIKYECVEKIEDDVDEEYCDLQTQTLNDNEIESAVGSIL